MPETRLLWTVEMSPVDSGCLVNFIFRDISVFSTISIIELLIGKTCWAGALRLIFILLKNRFLSISSIEIALSLILSRLDKESHFNCGISSS